VEVKKLENITNQNNTVDTNQEKVMNRVNQTFEQMVQDVRNMINENNQENSDQLT
jgi:actin-like ATPase involved in cell morphogenesis